MIGGSQIGATQYPGYGPAAGGHQISPGGLADQSLLQGPYRGRRRQGYCFFLTVVIVIFAEYFGYVSILLFPLLYPNCSWYGLSVFCTFHLFFILFLWAFFKCIATDPGVVPPNWGFYQGDDTKRKRYCKVCNVWKPDRTHHCSACGRCVLNMDHHCPWINNCVGFYNRKFFMQLLVYALVCLGFLVTHGFFYILHEGFVLWPGLNDPSRGVAKQAVGIVEYMVVCVMLFFATVLLFALVPFANFHFGLVSKNSTTIDNMDPQARERSRFDLGKSRNFEQVFGSRRILWWLPVHTKASRPVGDGVQWRLHYLRATDDEETEFQRLG